MTKQENNRLVNIGYFGGSHGAFLKCFVDKFSKKILPAKSSTLLKKFLKSINSSINEANYLNFDNQNLSLTFEILS